MKRTTRLVAEARRRRLEENPEDDGFTLIELLVVLLIIGILLAIAIPTFLSATQGAGDTTAQSNLQAALTNGKTIYLQNQDSFKPLTTAWVATDSGMTLAAAASTGPTSVSVAEYANDSIAIYAILSKQTNTCWGIVDDLSATTLPFGKASTPPGVPTGQVWTAPGTYYFGQLNDAAGCNASGFENNSPPADDISITGFVNPVTAT